MTGERMTLAAAELERLEREAATFDAQAEAKEADLAELTSQLGEAYLDGEASYDELAGRVARVQAEVLTARSIADAARRRVAEARNGQLLAHAADFRERADTVDVDTEAHEARTAELIAELEGHEGVTFALTPDALTRSARGRLEAAELRGKALICETAATGGRVAVESDLRSGVLLWASARAVAEGLGRPAADFVRHILVEDGLVENVPPAA
jgi:DNA repair exonuclease SbcCD ATPase subunit